MQLFGCDNIKSIVICDMTPKILNDENWNLGIMNERFDNDFFKKSLSQQFNDMKNVYVNLYVGINPSLEKVK